MSRITPKRLLLALAGGLGLVVFLAVLMFIPAGRVDLPWLWAYIVAYGLVAFWGFLLMDAGLLKERFRPGRNAHDTVLITIAKLLGLTHFVIAGLDVGRYHWSGPIPPALQLAALILFTGCGAALVWTMIVNRFFSPVVRIQDERGHHVVTGGLYRIVRHPGYVLTAVMFLVSGVALGSWWSLIPTAGFTLLVIRRTVIEDRFLHERLEGYPEYARRVPYRWIPQVW